MRKLGTTALTVLALGALGCGSSDEDAVKKTMQQYLSGVASGNGPRACRQLAPGAQREMVDIARLADESLGKTTSCVQVVNKRTPIVAEDELHNLQQAAGETDKLKVSVHGMTAVVEIRPPGLKVNWRLQKQGDRWLLVSANPENPQPNRGDAPASRSELITAANAVCATVFDDLARSVKAMRGLKRSDNVERVAEVFNDFAAVFARLRQGLGELQAPAADRAAFQSILRTLDGIVVAGRQAASRVRRKDPAVEGAGKRIERLISKFSTQLEDFGFPTGPRSGGCAGGD